MCWTLSSLMVLARISPARSAAQYHNHLMMHMFSRPYLNALASALAGPASIMRRLFVAFGLMGGLLSPTFAADYDLPVLRGTEPVAPVMTVGPATFTRWSGFYFGGDFSYSFSQADFSTATQPLLAFSLRNLTLEEVVHLPNCRCSARASPTFSAAAVLSVTIPSGRILSSASKRLTPTRT